MEVVEEDTGMREGPERQLERRHNDEGPKFADYASRRARVEEQHSDHVEPAPSILSLSPYYKR